MKPLVVYGWKVCPHCHQTVAWLRERNIPFEYREIEEQLPEVIQQVIAVNGGDDWVAPTLEHEGRWRAGEVFQADRLERQLRDWGLIP